MRQLVLALDQRDVGVAFQEVGGLGPVHAAEICDVGQHADIANILAILKISDEQALHDLVLNPLRFGPADQAV